MNAKVFHSSPQSLKALRQILVPENAPLPSKLRQHRLECLNGRCIHEMLGQAVVDMNQAENRTKVHVLSARDVRHVRFELSIVEVTGTFFEREEFLDRFVTLSQDTLVQETK